MDITNILSRSSLRGTKQSHLKINRNRLLQLTQTQLRNDDRCKNVNGRIEASESDETDYSWLFILVMEFMLAPQVLVPQNDSSFKKDLANSPTVFTNEIVAFISKN